LLDDPALMHPDIGLITARVSALTGGWEAEVDCTQPGTRLGIPRNPVHEMLRALYHPRCR